MNKIRNTIDYRPTAQKLSPPKSHMAQKLKSNLYLDRPASLLYTQQGKKQQLTESKNIWVQFESKKVEEFLDNICSYLQS